MHKGTLLPLFYLHQNLNGFFRVFFLISDKGENFILCMFSDSFQLKYG